MMTEAGHGHDHDRGVKAMLRYVRHAPRMWRSEINAAVIDAIAPRPGERVLDIGAGLCPATVLAARLGADVIAVEPTPYLRFIAQLRRLGQRSRRRITVVDGAAEDLPVADATMDAVWAVNSMHHWVDPDRAAAEITRVLVPNGRLVLVDENFDDPVHPDHQRFGGRHGDPEHHAFERVDPQRMAQRFRDLGYSSADPSPTELAHRPVLAVTATAPT